MVKQKRTAQEYDQTLKALFGQEVADILPILLPEAEFISEQNVAIDRTIIKADLVFRGHYKKLPHIFNMELQSSKDGRIEEVLKMEYAYDHLIDDNPDVLKRVERGRAEAKLEGRVEGVQKVVLTFVKSRFPALATQAKQQIGQIQDTDALESLFLRLTSAITEDEAREILQIRKGSRKQKP